MFILDIDQIRESDATAISQYGIPSIVLMENAASGAVDALNDTFPDAQRIVILAGRGNNGGDGMAMARHLHNRGRVVEIWLFGTQGSIRGDAGRNLRICKRIGIPITTIRSGKQFRDAAPVLTECDLIVDALFGTGLTKPLNGMYAEVVDAVNVSGKPVLAVDVPSGLSGSSREITGPVIAADLTVTFASLKIPHIFPPAATLVGEVVVVDIGIPYEVLAGNASLELLSAEAFTGLLPQRPLDSHKGNYGHVAVIAGSRDKPGAAAMAALAAYRVGAGLVTVASVQDVVSASVGASSEIMGYVLKEDRDGTIHPEVLPQLLEFCKDKDAVLIGPGVGTDEKTQDFLRTLSLGLARPLILDADALTAFSGKLSQLSKREEPTILTPHPGEMGRLLGVSTADVQSDRLKYARDAARFSGAVTLLKGFQSLIAVPGEMVYVNPTGNPGMAAGGMGDVLGGMVAGFLGQGLYPDAAASIGCFLHGRAADLATEKTGQASLMAGDVVGSIPQVLKWLNELS